MNLMIMKCLLKQNLYVKEDKVWYLNLLLKILL